MNTTEYMCTYISSNQMLIPSDQDPIDTLAFVTRAKLGRLKKSNTSGLGGVALAWHMRVLGFIPSKSYLYVLVHLFN